MLATMVSCVLCLMISFLVSSQGVFIEKRNLTKLQEMKYVGDFHGFYYEVAGHVFVVDNRTLLIQNFNYTGAGPGAYFWVGTMGTPRDTDESTTAFLAYPFDGKHYSYSDPSPTAELGKVENKNITLTLPPHIQAREVAWMSVWCRPFRANFGEIIFPVHTVVEEPASDSDNRGTEKYTKETETSSNIIDDGDNATEQHVVKGITEEPALKTTLDLMPGRQGKSFSDESEETSGEEKAFMNVNHKEAMSSDLMDDEVNENDEKVMDSAGHKVLPSIALSFLGLFVVFNFIILSKD